MLEYKYQKLPSKVVVWSDTDLAGCGRTRLALLEDVQPDTGDDRFVIWGVGVLRHREGCDDGHWDQKLVQGLGAGGGDSGERAQREAFHRGEVRGEFAT